MILLNSTEKDDLEFIKQIQNIIFGIIKRRNPVEIYLIHINNWFGPKWLGFSGKTLGALGVWNKELSIPPFHPNRVLLEKHYVWDDAFSKWDTADSCKPIHLKQWSSNNLSFARRVSELTPHAALIWYSGNSKKNRRGSLMVYLPTTEVHWPWYVGFCKKQHWVIDITEGISNEELKALSYENG